MAEQKGIAMTILGVVAIIAIVGLVLLFTKVGATGQVAGVSKVGKSYLPANPERLIDCDWPDYGVTVVDQAEPGCMYVACNEDKLPTGGFNPGNIKKVCGRTY